MALYCRDLSSLKGLESIHLRGGSNGASNEIRWPYVAENRSFEPWIKGGELVFVTGISRHRTPENLAQALYEGKACNIAGLVVLTGDAFISRLPQSLCKLADELNLPLFEQPYSLPMVTVTETISRAIIKAEQMGSLMLAQELDSQSVELLSSWVRNMGNQKAMAQDLNCHRNTIRNRLKQITHVKDCAEAQMDYFKQLLLTHLLSKS
ncbi:MAG: hypothetical protein ACJA1U_002697 [Bermanella sp.]|jgi:hypothetical protein